MTRGGNRAPGLPPDLQAAGRAPAVAADDELLLDVPLPREMFSPTGLLALSDLLPVMCAFMDRDLVFRFVNKPYAEWFERPRSEILGRTLGAVIGEGAARMRRPMLTLALAGERQFFAIDYQHPTRGAVAVQTEYVPWIGPAGTVDGLVAVITDVTEQRAAERALRESEARFKRIANSAPVMMWVTRLDRVRDFVNDTYAEFMGLSQEEARTSDWRGFIHPDDQDRVVAESLAGEATGRPFTLEARYRRADGEWRWLSSVSSPRFGTEGDLVGFIGVASDITLAKEAEFELRRLVDERTAKLADSEAQFRAIFDTILEVVVLLTRDGTIVQLNRKEAAWRDRDHDSAIGRKIWDAPTLQAYPQHQPLIRRAVEVAAAGGLFSEEVKMERAGVPTSYLDVSVQPVRDGDGAIRFLLFEARDITELKVAQEQLRQSQKMEALGQLTGGIAHDFNNLLTVVVGGLDLITKRAEEPKLKRYAENALAAAERGARLTGQLLAFSRVQRLEIKPTLVAPLIENMRPLLRNVLGPGIEKRFDLEQGSLPVMADPTQLEVAVLNLAINARDAMPEGGVLSFTSRTVRISGDSELADGDYVELCITDTGSGMPEDVAARAFEPFFTTKEVGKGTGLGLSMVYGMARQSGGAVRIHSRLHQGTSVTLWFRAAQAAVEADPEGAAEPVDTKSSEPSAAAILVIDDDPDVRGFIVAALRELGFNVREASEGIEGLKLIADERPDLVILDFIMPGMSGADVANRIYALDPDQRILFVSGYSETEAVKRVAPDAPLLAKPFRADALAQAVRGALAGNGPN